MINSEDENKMALVYQYIKGNRKFVTHTDEDVHNSVFKSMLKSILHNNKKQNK